MYVNQTGRRQIPRQETHISDINDACDMLGQGGIENSLTPGPTGNHDNTLTPGPSQLFTPVVTKSYKHNSKTPK